MTAIFIKRKLSDEEYIKLYGAWYGGHILYSISYEAKDNSSSFAIIDVFNNSKVKLFISEELKLAMNISSNAIEEEFINFNSQREAEDYILNEFARNYFKVISDDFICYA
jgi:hypothetical protein